METLFTKIRTEDPLHAAILDCYGVRARLVDLQAIRSAGSRSADLVKLIEEANRLVEQTDRALFEMIEQDNELGWRAWEMIKESCNGSIQRLSQRLKAALPPRGSERPVMTTGDFRHGFKPMKLLFATGAAFSLLLGVIVIDQSVNIDPPTQARGAENSLLAVKYRR